METSCAVPMTDAVTTPSPVLCAVSSGYSEYSIQFVSLENLADAKYDCGRCDASVGGGNDYCDIVLDICISDLGSK